MTVRRGLISLILAVVIAAALTAALAAGEGEQGELGLTPEMMQAWTKASTPNEHHRHLAKLAGNWSTTGKFWMQPGAEPTVSSGQATNEMIMNGRFLQSKFEGDFMGQPFVGMGLDGYDNTLGKHIGSWIDNMGTMMMQFVGECAENGKVLTSMTEFTDPISGQPAKMKGKITVVDDNTYTYESWSQEPGASDFYKSMEITYKRR